MTFEEGKSRDDIWRKEVSRDDIWRKEVSRDAIGRKEKIGMRDEE